MVCRKVLISAVLALLATPAAGATVQDVVDQVSQTDYAAFLSGSLYAHSGDSRGFSAQHDLAKTNLVNEFQSLGLSTALEPFTYNGSTYYNVVATLPGTVHSDQVYIVGAHYDSVGTPGADDNASGVAGVVEAARALSQYSLESTVRFVAFDREEQGLYGSTAYAAAHSSDNIQGMVSMDMIAFNHADPTHHDKAWVYYPSANAKSLAVTQDLVSALSSYGNIAANIDEFGYSDHVPFDAWGSALLIEHAMTKGAYANPYYHTASDAIESTYSYGGQTYDYIDYGYATNMTRGVVGYLATEARVVPEPGTLVLLALGALCLLAYRSSRGGRRFAAIDLLRD